MEFTNFNFPELAKTLSSALLFLFASRIGLISLSLVLILALAIRLYRDLHASSLAEQAAGRPIRPLNTFLCILDSLGRVFARLLVSLPTLVLLALSVTSLIAAGSALSKIEEAARAAERKLYVN